MLQHCFGLFQWVEALIADNRDIPQRGKRPTGRDYIVAMQAKMLCKQRLRLLL